MFVRQTRFQEKRSYILSKLIFPATFILFVSPAWSQSTVTSPTSPKITIGTGTSIPTIVPHSQPGAKSFLVTPLSENQQKAEQDIRVRTGPMGIPKDKIPPRNKALVASYVGMDADELWKHLKDSKQLAIVGIKEPGHPRGFFGGKSLVSQATIKQAHSELLSLTGVKQPFLVKKAHMTLPIMGDKRRYPAIIVYVGSLKALGRIRNLPYVDFVEPLYPTVVYQSAFGCDLSSYGGSSSDGGFSAATGGGPNLVPWNYTHHFIRQTWGLFPSATAPGAGVDLFETDTGVFPSQRQFSSNVFSTPTPSVSRSFTQINYKGDSRVKCSHGTRIAGLAAAPADTSAIPNIVGIAWGSSLVSQSVGDGVVHFDTASPSLAMALRDAAASTVFNGIIMPTRNRVLLMAWGMPWESQFIRDVIQSAYDDNDKLIMVAAAGTIVPSVVFPATMRRETVAVSLVEAPNPAVMTYGLVPPVTSGLNTVAYGGEVRFVAVNSVLSGLALPTTGKGIDAAGQSVNSDGDLVPASGLPASEVGEITTLGGSSSAVSIIGGGLALAWSRMPFLSRDQLLDRFVTSSSCSLIGGLSAACRDSFDHRVVGDGVPDFYKAAGGARSLWIEGPSSGSSGNTIELNVGMDGDPKLYNYLWSTGSTAETIILEVHEGEALTVSLTATNLLDGSTLTANRQIVGGPTNTRILYSTVKGESWSTFFDGHRISFTAMGTLPAGCMVTAVYGQELLVGGPTPGAPIGTIHESVDHGNRGFSVYRTAFGPQNLDVLVTAWHDGLSSIRVRPAYSVQQPPGVDCNSGGTTQTSP